MNEHIFAEQVHHHSICTRKGWSEGAFKENCYKVVEATKIINHYQTPVLIRDGSQKKSHYKWSLLELVLTFETELHTQISTQIYNWNMISQIHTQQQIYPSKVFSCGYTTYIDRDIW